MDWPDGKRFAFSIVDDTDRSTVENVGPVYDLLHDCGILTTKTVWPIGFSQPPRYGGGTLDDEDYRDWVLELRDRGFEIAFHGATDHSSLRADTERALDRFREVLGHDPRMHINHRGQIEALYWGNARLDGPAGLGYRLVHKLLRRDTQYFGHVERSPYFWGDLCRDRITYVRSFTFPEVNTLQQNPFMPYHDPRRPYVRYWFSASDAPDGDAFCRLLDEQSQDRLVSEGGACIAYTHFAYGFMEGGRVRKRFADLMRRLAEQPGWFVPASTLLDHLRAQPAWREQPSARDLRGIQRRWLVNRLRHGRL